MDIFYFIFKNLLKIIFLIEVELCWFLPIINMNQHMGFFFFLPHDIFKIHKSLKIFSICFWLRLRKAFPPQILFLLLLLIIIYFFIALIFFFTV